MRTERKDIDRITTATMIIDLTETQYFCETDKAYEIWDTSPLLHRVKRISKKSVLWVIEKMNVLAIF